jgi:phosphotransferase system HPr-like phosphotransfer protein
VPAETNHSPNKTSSVGKTSNDENYDKKLLVNGVVDHEDKKEENLDPLPKGPKFGEIIHQRLIATIASNQQNERNSEHVANISTSTSAITSTGKNYDSNSFLSTEDNELQEHIKVPLNVDAIEVEDADVAKQRPNSPIQIEKDVFGFYSLSMICKSKDLTERKVKIDFARQVDSSSDGQQGDSKSVVARVRGQFVIGETLSISFEGKDMAESCVTNPALLAKYPTLRAACLEEVVPDKDGHFSIEFVNSGMSGIREITNEFSRHGEVVKVMAGGAKSNAVKRVTVSYSDKDAAFAAVNAAHSKNRNKDFQSVDFAKESLVQVDRRTSIPHSSFDSSNEKSDLQDNLET